MKKNLMMLLSAGILTGCLLGGCGENAADTESTIQSESSVASLESGSDVTEEKSQEVQASIEETQTASDESTCPLEDGIYLASFKTDSSMFRINETKDGKGVLTVANGKMTIHVTLLSKKVLNLYAGLAEDASREGAELLQPTIDVVTYSDGLSEEVYGFDIPVPYLEDEFDVALIGTKGSWYDHKVSVSNVQEYTEEKDTQTEKTSVSDSEYYAAVTLGGGTGKATVESPAVITYVDGQAYARLVWSSKNYDYMIVDEVKYLNEAEPGEQSVFTIPIVFDEEMEVIGDTVAMSTPHEIDYTLLFQLEE